MHQPPGMQHSAPITILVIEDNETLRLSILDILSWEGYRALGAADGVEGVAVLEHEMPDLIVCDIMMPGMDGYAVLERLRANPAYRTLPFIFLTALAEQDDVRHGMESGAVDYLTKPFSMRDLLSAVRTQLRKHADYRDMTERRLDALRRQLITSLPHELRTPLTSVLGYTEIMLEDGEHLSAEEMREYLKIVHGAGMRLKHLAENYLYLAHLEVAEYKPALLHELRSQWTANPEQLAALASEEQALTFERAADLALALDRNLPPVAMSVEHWKKIIEELVNNAFKFSEPGTPVVVSVGVADSRLLLRVMDQGRGMTNEQIEAMGAYMQFDRSRYEQQGAGLGLTIARKLVALHGGQFAIESTPDSGTMVNVALPLAAEADDTQDAA